MNPHERALDERFWVAVHLSGPRLAMIECGHTRTRLHYRRGGADPSVPLLSTLGILAHAVRADCPCALGMWQQLSPQGICLAASQHLDRRLPPTEVP
jgi:hypothetical protein